MTKEMILEYVIDFLALVSGRIPLNICKVFTAAFAGGAFLSMAFVDAYPLKACFAVLVCLLLACFFGSMALMYEEVYED